MEYPRPKIVAASWRQSAEYRTFVGAVHARRLPVTLVNGCFDLFHSGHARLLAFAAEQSLRYFGQAPTGPLVVAVNSDESVLTNKGPGRPVLPWAERAAVLAAVGVVDVVVGFDETTPLQLVAQLRPALLVKGGDYEGKPVPEMAGLPPSSAILYCPREPGDVSSSWVVERVVEAEKKREKFVATTGYRGP